MRLRHFLLTFIAVTGTSLAQTTPPAVPAPRPAIDFARLPFISDPELSPDGTKVAARIAIGGVQTLRIMPLFPKPDEKPVGIALGSVDLLGWQWVNDQWLVVRLGKTQPIEDDEAFISRAVAVRADGGKLVPLAVGDGGQDSSRILWVAHDGSPRILLRRQTSFYTDQGFWPMVSEVDVSTGKMRTVATGVSDVMNWYADGNGVVRIGEGYDDASRRSRLLYRDANGQPFRIVNRADGTRHEELTIPEMFLADPTKALVRGNKSNVDALYEMDMASFTVGPRVFGVDGYDLGDVIPDVAGTGLAGVDYTSDHARTHWFDATLAQVQTDLDKAVAPRLATITSMSRDHTRMLVRVTSPDQPGSIYYYNTALGRMQLFSHISPELKSAHFAPVSTIRYKARDGMEIAAVLTLPKGRDAHNLPLVVLPHGGPAARDSEEWDWWVQFLADRGYAVVQPNYRGSTGYGTIHFEAGRGEWGLKMQDDLLDAIDAVAARGIADPKRVCIAGASYGGYAAMRGAERDGTRYRCAISFAGVADLGGIMRYDSQFLNGNATRTYWKGTAPDLRAVSPVNNPAGFSAPMLIMHGKKDLRVPVGQSRRMAAGLRAAGKTVRYVEQPEGDHHFSREADRLQFLTEMEAWLKQYNPA